MKNASQCADSVIIQKLWYSDHDNDTKNVIHYSGFTLYDNDGPYNDLTDLVVELDKNEMTNENLKENAAKTSTKRKTEEEKIKKPTKKQKYNDQHDEKLERSDQQKIKMIETYNKQLEANKRKYAEVQNKLNFSKDDLEKIKSIEKHEIFQTNSREIAKIMETTAKSNQ